MPSCNPLSQNSDLDSSVVPWPGTSLSSLLYTRRIATFALPNTTKHSPASRFTSACRELTSHVPKGNFVCLVSLPHLRKAQFIITTESIS